jgi:hypothetical protein
VRGTCPQRPPAGASREEQRSARAGHARREVYDLGSFAPNSADAAPVIAKPQDAIKTSVESQSFKDAGMTIGFVPAYLPAQDFEDLIANDDMRLAKILDDLGLKRR